MASSGWDDDDSMFHGGGGSGATEMLMSPQEYDDFDAELREIALECSLLDTPVDISVKNVKVECIESTPTPPPIDVSDANPTNSKKAPMTDEERRRQRNLKERKRVQGVRERVQKLRKDLEILQQKHDRLQSELEQRVNAGSDDEEKMDVVSVVSAGGPELLRRYLSLVKETEELQKIKQSLEATLRPRIIQTSAIRTMAAVESDYRLSHRAEIPETAFTLPQPKLSMVIDTHSRSRTPSVIHMDAVAVLESMIVAEPLTANEAKALVEETCRDMMESLTRLDWTYRVGEIAGWRGGYVVDRTMLRFRVSQVFPSVTATELMQKTWGLLTDLEGYRRIQPQTTQLKVLQRVNDEVWVIGASVGGHLVRHSVLLVARALIHGGCLITFRSLPLVRKDNVVSSHTARQRFVEEEAGGIYVNIFTWYNFQERPRADGNGVECEVIFGGSARNGDEDYLSQLRLELFTGITRWQSAVGFSQFQFSADNNEMGT